MARNCSHHFVVFKFDKPMPNGNIYNIWKSYDEDMIWDSPNVEVLGYFDTYKQAQAAVAANKRGL